MRNKINLLTLLLRYFGYKISLFESRKNLLCGKSPTIHIRANITLSLPLLLLCCPGWFCVCNLQKWSWEHDVCGSLFLTPNYRPLSLYLFLKIKKHEGAFAALRTPSIIFVVCFLFITNSNSNIMKLPLVERYLLLLETIVPATRRKSRIWLVKMRLGSISTSSHRPRLEILELSCEIKKGRKGETGLSPDFQE